MGGYVLSIKTVAFASSSVVVVRVMPTGTGLLG